MTFNLTGLAKRLKSARTSAGITQEAAADTLGVPRTAIVHIEAGNRSVSSLELAAFAELYRCPITYFFSPETSEEDDEIMVTLLRLQPGLNDNRSVTDQINRCVTICRIGADLEAKLGRKPRLGPPAYVIGEPKNTFDAVEQGALVAAEERSRLGLGDSPIRDIAELISSQSVWVASAELTPEMSGLFLMHSSTGMVILVNSAHGSLRNRFSFAHEYAHALLDRTRAVNVTTAQNAPDLIEKRANAFAAAFLAPRGGVERLLEVLNKGSASRRGVTVYSDSFDAAEQSESRAAAGSQNLTCQDVAMIAHHFGVSYQAAAYRLRSLDCIAKTELEHLLTQEQLGREYQKLLRLPMEHSSKEDRKPQQRELVAQVAHATGEAFRRKLISYNQVLEHSKQLRIKGEDLARLVSADGGD